MQNNAIAHGAAFWDRVDAGGANPQHVMALAKMDTLYHRSMGALRAADKTGGKARMFDAGGFAEQALMIYAWLKYEVSEHDINGILKAIRRESPLPNGDVDTTGISEMIKFCKLRRTLRIDVSLGIKKMAEEKGGCTD